jgi:haloalkane dehalogenase
MKKRIASDFPFQSKYINILEGTLHFIDEPSPSINSQTFLFIHGNPTSCYLWRNIIPYTLPFGRCIAVDLIGFGKSSKPSIEYSFIDHITYMNAFIAALKLENFYLVLHDWGGAIGFQYAMRNSYNIKGLVFMETFCRPMLWKKFDIVTRFLFRNLTKDKVAAILIGKFNLFITFILPMSIVRHLSREERAIYRQPFKTLESRKPIVKLPQELPFKNSGSENEKIAKHYFDWLCQTKIPKLLLYAKPGVQIKEKEALELKKLFRNTTLAYIGKGKHYIQEDQPDAIGQAIQLWLLSQEDD